MKSIYYTGLNTSNGQEKVILNINITLIPQHYYKIFF